MASTYLSRTNGTATTRTKCTFSAWFKYDQTSGTNTIIVATDDSGANTYFQVELKPDIDVQIRDGSSATYLRRRSNAPLKDALGWYHIVVTFDSTLGTADDRLKIFLNGERITSFSDNTGTVDSDYNCPLFKSSIPMKIGVGQSGSSNFFSGIMSHIHATDGYAYEASTFGETDATTGEWKIKTSPSVTYGDNGFFILKDDNSVTDQSGEGNNFTVGAGTLTKTEDNPSNVFCTMLPMMNYANGTPTFANGNTVINGSGSAWLRTSGSIGNRTGKFYYEAYLQAYYGSDRPIRIGWDSLDYPRQGADTYFSGFNISSDGFIRGGIAGVDAYDPNADALGVTLAEGDYVGLAIDLDNDLVTCYKNGTVISNVNGLDISGNSNCSVINSKGYQVTPSVNFYAVSTNDNEIYFNFGNGAFGSTQLTGTTYTDSAGRGVFKYQPPTNYLAWCTRNFNE